MDSFFDWRRMIVDFLWSSRVKVFMRSILIVPDKIQRQFVPHISSNKRNADEVGTLIFE